MITTEKENEFSQDRHAHILMEEYEELKLLQKQMNEGKIIFQISERDSQSLQRRYRQQLESELKSYYIQFYEQFCEAFQERHDLIEHNMSYSLDYMGKDDAIKTIQLALEDMEDQKKELEQKGKELSDKINELLETISTHENSIKTLNETIQKKDAEILALQPKDTPKKRKWWQRREK